MKNINFIYTTAVVLFFGCASLKNDTSKKQSFIEASVDLINVENDKVKIIINPPKIAKSVDN